MKALRNSYHYHKYRFMFHGFHKTETRRPALICVLLVKKYKPLTSLWSTIARYAQNLLLALRFFHVFSRKRDCSQSKGKLVFVCPAIIDFTITAEIHARSLVNFYGHYADRHMNLKFVRRVSEREREIRQFVIVKNKLMSVFNVPVLLLTMNFVITLSKYSADPLGYRLVDPQLL